MAHPKAGSPQLTSWTALRPPAECSAVRAGRRATMEKITTIGLDIAKSVFQVHGVDAAGEVVVRKRLSRARVIPFFAKLPRCLVDIEACNTSHHWARERSEEHTSELQSLMRISYAVFCLKKKNKQHHQQDVRQAT